MILSFDLDGTLINDFVNDFFYLVLIPRYLAKIKGIDVHSAVIFCIREYKKFEGRDEWYDPNFWLKYFNLDKYKEEILRHLEKLDIDFMEDCIPEVLKSLEDKFKIIILTSNPKEFIEIKVKKVKLKYPVYSSFEIAGSAKRKEFYEKISEILGTKNIIHIGDDFFIDYLEARRAGIKAILYDPKNRYKIEDKITSFKELPSLLQRELF